MTRLVARLVLAMMILPFSGTLFVILMAVLVGGGRPPKGTEFVVMWAVLYTFVAVYWVFVWRSVVRWTPNRVIFTFVMGVVAILLTLVFGLLIAVITREDEMAYFFGGGVAPVFWVFTTILIWRESAGERRARLTAAGVDTVACLVCGYNMTGLSEARCPECGARFTLDQLLGAQRTPERGELDET